MRKPGGWVNLANIMESEAAAKLTGASDSADEIIPYSEFRKFEMELEELREVRERFSTAAVKHMAEEQKTAGFRLELRRTEDKNREIRKSLAMYKAEAFIFFLLMISEAFVLVWIVGHGR